MARASRVETPTTGLPIARARPLTVLTPILSPVNEPGPTVQASRSTSSGGDPCQKKQLFQGRKQDFRMVSSRTEIKLGQDLLFLQKGQSDGFRRAFYRQGQHRYPVNHSDKIVYHLDIQPLDIHHEDKNHQQNQEDKTDLLGHFPPAEIDLTARHHFDPDRTADARRPEPEWAGG